MSKPFKFKRIELWRRPTLEEAELWARGLMPTRQITEDELRDERPVVWPVGAKIPIKEEEEVADADATLEARASRSNPEE